MKTFYYWLIASLVLLFASCKKEDNKEDATKDIIELRLASDQYSSACGKILDIPFEAYYEGELMNGKADIWVDVSLISNNTGDTNFYDLGLFYNNKTSANVRLVMPHKAGTVIAKLQLLIDGLPKGNPKNVTINITPALVNYQALIREGFSSYAIGADNSVVLSYNLLRISQDGSLIEPLRNVIGQDFFLNNSTDDGKFLFRSSIGMVKTYDPVTKTSTIYELGQIPEAIIAARGHFFYSVRIDEQSSTLNIAQYGNTTGKMLGYFQGPLRFFVLRTGGVLAHEFMWGKVSISFHDTSTSFTTTSLPDAPNLIQYVGNDLYLVGSSAVYRSVDDAKNWTKVGDLPVLTGKSIKRVAITPEHLYLGVSEGGNENCDAVLISSSLSNLSFTEKAVPLPFRAIAPLSNGNLVLNCHNRLTYLFKPQWLSALSNQPPVCPSCVCEWQLVGHW